MNRFKGGINLKNNVELNIDLIIEEYSHYVFTIIYNLAGNLWTWTCTGDDKSNTSTTYLRTNIIFPSIKI